MAAVGLEAAARTNPYDLGASRRKLLALASVQAMRTPVLVLDEPTTGQDMRGRGDRAAGDLEARKAGRTVIAISHDMEFVATAFDRVVVLRRRPRSWPRAAGLGLRAVSLGAAASTYLEPPLPAVMGAGWGSARPRPTRPADGAGRGRGSVVARRRRKRPAVGVDPLLGRQLVAMTAPVVGPGIGSAMTELGPRPAAGRSRAAQAGAARRRSDRRMRGRAAGRTPATEGADSSSTPRTASGTLTWFRPSWRSSRSRPRFASRRARVVKCGVRLTSTRVR